MGGTEGSWPGAGQKYAANRLTGDMASGCRDVFPDIGHLTETRSNAESTRLRQCGRWLDLSGQRAASIQNEFDYDRLWPCGTNNSQGGYTLGHLEQVAGKEDVGL